MSEELKGNLLGAMLADGILTSAQSFKPFSILVLTLKMFGFGIVG